MLGRLRHLSECRRVSARLWDYRKGDLAADEAERVHIHLAHCQICAAEMVFVERAAAAANVLSERTPAPRRGWDEIRESLTSEARRPVRRWARPAAWALGAATLLAAVLFWPRPGAQSPVSRPPVVVKNEPSSIPAPIVKRDHSPERSVALSTDVAPQPIRRKPSAFARIDPPRVNGRRGERRMAWHVEPYPAKIASASAGPAGAPISVARSSEMELAESGTSPKWVTGSMPVSSEALVTGSAPSGMDEPAVSVEPAFDQEAEP